MKFAWPPLPWIAARFRWEVRERDGSKVLAKTTDKLILHRALSFIGHPDESVALLPRSAFRYINAPEELKGNLGRNTFRKGRIGNINAGLWKSWPLSTDWQIMLRAEAINLTNTPQFAEPAQSHSECVTGDQFMVEFRNQSGQPLGHLRIDVAKPLQHLAE